MAEFTLNDFISIKKDQCRKSNNEIVEEYFTIEREDVVVIIALTEENNLILVRQFRQPVNSVNLELPAGHINKGETPENAAHRELLEETGYQCKNLKKIGACYASAGIMNNTIHYFLGKDAKQISEQDLDQNEEIEIQLTVFKTALKMIESGKIKDLGSVNGVFLAEKHIIKPPLV